MPHRYTDQHSPIVIWLSWVIKSSQFGGSSRQAHWHLGSFLWPAPLAVLAGKYARSFYIGCNRKWLNTPHNNLMGKPHYGLNIWCDFHHERIPTIKKPQPMAIIPASTIVITTSNSAAHPPDIVFVYRQPNGLNMSNWSATKPERNKAIPVTSVFFWLQDLVTFLIPAFTHTQMFSIIDIFINPAL